MPGKLTRVPQDVSCREHAPHEALQPLIPTLR